MTKTLTFISISAIVLVLPLALVAQGGFCTVQLTASGGGNDTFITRHPNLGGPNSNHGTQWGMWVIGSLSFESYPLMFFDVGSLGPDCQMAISPGTITLNVIDTYGQGLVSQNMELLRVLVPWVEDDVTWNSFGPGIIKGENVDFAPLDVKGVTAGPCAYPAVIPPATPHPVSCSHSAATFTVPMDTLQAWIDDPTTNYGVLVYSSTLPVHKDIVFATRENQYHYPGGSPVPGPSLTFVGCPATGC